MCDQDLDLHEIIVETERRGMTFDQLLTMPEQDDWVYSDGKSTTCVAFILEMYKEAGIFGTLANSIQVTEFTVSATALHHGQIRLVLLLCLPEFCLFISVCKMVHYNETLDLDNATSDNNLN